MDIFSVKNAWGYIRLKMEKEDILKPMLIKKIAFENVIFLWRLWKFRIPVDRVLQNIGIQFYLNVSVAKLLIRRLRLTIF